MRLIAGKQSGGAFNDSDNDDDDSHQIYLLLVLIIYTVNLASWLIVGLLACLKVDQKQLIRMVSSRLTITDLKQYRSIAISADRCVE